VKSRWFRKMGKKRCRFEGVKYPGFSSKRRAKTWTQMWSKTIEKWKLKANGWEDNDAFETCGLCDNFYDSHHCESTGSGCPCSLKNHGHKRGSRCIPFDTAEEELMWLLSVKAVCEQEGRKEV
jgi:hypothetical protein